MTINKLSDWDPLKINCRIGALKLNVVLCRVAYIFNSSTLRCNLNTSRTKNCLKKNKKIMNLVYFLKVVHIIMAGLRSKYQLFCFALRYLIIFFLILLFLSVGSTDLTNGYKPSQNSNGSSIRCAGDNIIVSFPTILLPFPPFPGADENTYSQFSRKLFNKFDNCLRMIKVVEFYKSVRHERRLPHNLVSIFQVENVSPGNIIKVE